MMDIFEKFGFFNFAGFIKIYSSRKIEIELLQTTCATYLPINACLKYTREELQQVSCSNAN